MGKKEKPPGLTSDKFNNLRLAATKKTQEALQRFVGTNPVKRAWEMDVENPLLATPSMFKKQKKEAGAQEEFEDQEESENQKESENDEESDAQEASEAEAEEEFKANVGEVSEWIVGIYSSFFAFIHRANTLE
jgi:hypothetical protein